MSILARREWALEVGTPGGRAVRYEGMRMTFEVRLGGDPTDHGATIGYWMPPLNMVHSLGAEDIVVRVLAGYEDGGAVEMARGAVVAGSIKDRRGSTDPNVEFQISAAGTEMLPVLSRSMPGPVSASEVIEQIRADLGLPADSIDLADDPVFERGYMLSGTPRAVLSELALSTGCNWDLPDGRLRFWPRGQPARQLRDLWTSGTGLLEVSGPGSQRTIEAMALLRPAMRPGDIVRIDDQSHQGDIVVQDCTHSGDTFGDPWFTRITGRPLDG